jgi:hypothetical protein
MRLGDCALRFNLNFKNNSTSKASDRSVRPTLECSARQAQGSFDRFDNLRIHVYPRI